MALQKAIKQADGVTTNYHRVQFVTITTNRSNAIAVLSYVDSEARQNEQADASFKPYKEAVTYVTDYDPNMTVETAYDFLKTLPQFNGAEDV